MRVLVVADIHNDVENILQLLDKSKEFKFDVVVCPGDFTDVPPTGFSREKIAKLILEELRSLGKPVLVTPGNQDGSLIRLFEELGVSIHGAGRVIDDVGFYGFGGAKTPFGTVYEPSESDVLGGLKRAFESVKTAGLKVQVTHTPPINTKVDLVASGAHVGSEAVRSFIETEKPHVAISAHIHEARGVDVIGVTKVVNPGRFPEGYCAIIDLTAESVDAKIVNLI